MSRVLDSELGSLAERLLVEAGGEELEPMIRCPRWDRCSAPICPLDPQKGMRTGSGTGELVCRLPKAKRLELGALLPWRGLWPRELGQTRRREQESEEVRAEKGRQLAAGRRKGRSYKALGT